MPVNPEPLNLNSVRDNSPYKVTADNENLFSRERVETYFASFFFIWCIQNLFVFTSSLSEVLQTPGSELTDGSFKSHGVCILQQTEGPH
jgi:hypothetical protein